MTGGGATPTNNPSVAARLEPAVRLMSWCARVDGRVGGVGAGSGRAGRSTGASAWGVVGMPAFEEAPVSAPWRQLAQVRFDTRLWRAAGGARCEICVRWLPIPTVGRRIARPSRPALWRPPAARLHLFAARAINGPPRTALIRTPMLRCCADVASPNAADQWSCLGVAFHRMSIAGCPRPARLYQPDPRATIG